VRHPWVIPLVAAVGVLAVALVTDSDRADGPAPAPAALMAQVPQATDAIAPGGGRWHVTASPPIDPAQADLPFGRRSHWLQPWRSYLDTWPATRLRDAIGINFNVLHDIDDAARRLTAAGFRRARVELSWPMLRYDDPTRLTEQQGRLMRLRLLALRRHGIRPLILLNSNAGGPAPNLPFTATLTQPARAGDRTLAVDAATAARVVPGRSGIDRPGLMAGTLFTGVESGGIVRLARPLREDLAAGAHPAHVLRYAPFAPPLLPDGTPDASAEETWRGWLDYVGTATGFVRRTLGDTRFDVEIWNELSFGSAFLNRGNYYEVAPANAAETIPVLLERTVAWLRDPAHGLRGVGIADGFASQRPWDSAASVPAGVTAISKHPYHSAVRFPQQALINTIVPLDAQGDTDYTAIPQAVGDAFARDRFIPRYRAYLPEWFLTALQTETLVRDLSPDTSEIYRTPHGRHSAPAGREPVAVWLTEMALDPAGADPSAPVRDAALTPVTRRAARVQAAAALRTLVAYIGKGAGAVYLYAAAGRPFGLLDNPTAMAALRRLTRPLAAARPIGHVRPLRLEEVADTGRGVQFRGDGTAAHPSLHARDVLAFLPFQLDAHAWLAPVYVMTRDLARRQAPAPFLLRIGGLDGRRATVELSDPLTGDRAPARIVARSADGVTVRLSVSDAPRLLTLRER
jgi:hypothetical protein